MKNEMILYRSIEIETWGVQGSIAKAQERKDMMLVLLYLEEFSGGTAKDLAKHLLFDDKGRFVVAERLLEISKLYKLVDFENGRYMLTEDGKEALSKKEVFIPNDGCWELSVSNDPLLPHKFISVDAFKEPNAKDEIFDKAKLEDRIKNMKPLPRWIKDNPGLEVIPHAGGKRIRIDSIENKAEELLSKLSITLEWNISKGSIRLKNEKQILNQFDSPKLSQNDVWEILLAKNNWLDDWDSLDNNLAISFEEADEDERKHMVADFEFNSPTISEYGEFKDVIVRGIELRAATKNDAVLWADWRLSESINNFATSKNYQAWVSEALVPFKKFEITLPARDAYAQDLWDKSINTTNKTKAWNMIAATDWAL